MILLANLVRVTETEAPQSITHFNLFRSAEINGSPANGYSSAQAIGAMEQLAARVLLQGVRSAWSGISLEELEAGSQTVVLFTLGLVLAAQYESFVDPFIILLAVPVALFGALLAQSLRGLQNDVFCQIGLVMLIGLSSKNAILLEPVCGADAVRARRGHKKAPAEAIYPGTHALSQELMQADS